MTMGDRPMIHRFTLSDEESRAEFQRVSKDLLEHNAAQSVNYWAGSPFPTMLIWAGRIYDFLRVMEEIVGFYPARRQSYLVGYRSGADGAAVNESLAKGKQQREAQVQLLSRGGAVLAGAGWGRATIEYDEAGKKVRWEFREGTAIGLAARLEGLRTKPACPFIAGVVAGWTNRALGTELEFEETNCVARGDDRCVFESLEFLRPKKEFVE